MTQTQDAIEILDDLFGDTPGYRQAVAEEVENLRIASLIYEARNAAGLSQRQLADKINSKQSVISRLEDADYEGHSLTMLRKIASALGYKVDVKLVRPGEASVEASAFHPIQSSFFSQSSTWKPKATVFKTEGTGKRKMFESAYGSGGDKALKPGGSDGRRIAA